MPWKKRNPERPRPAGGRERSGFVSGIYSMVKWSRRFHFQADSSCPSTKGRSFP
jgi:hypothetical protein